MEDFYIGGASVKLFLPIFTMNFPEIVDLALPAEASPCPRAGRRQEFQPEFLRNLHFARDVLRLLRAKRTGQCRTDAKKAFISAA